MGQNDYLPDAETLYALGRNDNRRKKIQAHVARHDIRKNGLEQDVAG